MNFKIKIWGIRKAGILFLLFLFTTAFAEQDPMKKYRSFSAPNGRSMVGRIVEYSQSQKKILFEMKDRQKRWVSPVIFCDKDQIYIQEWIKAQEFISKGKVKYSIKRIVGKKITEKGGIIKEKTPVFYELKIINTSSRPIQNIIIEYNYLINREGVVNKYLNQVWVSGEIVLKEMIPIQGTKICKTPLIVLNKFSKKNTMILPEPRGFIAPGIPAPPTFVKKTYLMNLMSQRLVGIWFKVYGPTLDGIPVAKDISVPPDFSKKHIWIPVGKVSPFNGVFITEYSQIENSPKIVDVFKRFGEKGLVTDSDQRKDIIEEMICYYNPQYDKILHGFFSNWIGKLLCKEGDFKEAVLWYEKSSKYGHNIELNKLLVEYYAFSCPNVYDGKKAFEYVLIFMENKKQSIPNYELLAAVYARNGQFMKAIIFQNKAIKLHNKKTKYKIKPIRMEKRLERYKKQKPLTVEYVQAEKNKTQGN